MNLSPKKKPSILDGIQVLDFSQVLSGPYCTRMLADMGAEVIKIERPPAEDSVRNFPAIKEGLSGSFLQYNAGKKSLCIDLKIPRSIEIIKELIKFSDVVVENFNVGAMARMGVGYKEF